MKTEFKKDLREKEQILYIDKGTTQIIGVSVKTQARFENIC